MAIAHVFVACAQCGTEIDRVEYDKGVESPAVTAVMGALDLSAEAARKLVASKNAGAEKTSEENARELGSAIASKSVKGRGKSTYSCPSGCDAELQVTDSTPAPAVNATALVKSEG